MDQLVIRSYQPSDKQKIKDLYRLSSIHSEIGYRSGPWEADFDDIEGHFLKEGEFLVGLVNDEIVAIGGYRKMSNDIGQIRRMRTYPNYRRKGYAQLIIKKLEEIANQNKIKELRLKTSTQQKMAQNFYEKNGYEKLITDKKEYYTEGGENSFEVIWYRKKF